MVRLNFELQNTFTYKCAQSKSWWFYESNSGRLVWRAKRKRKKKKKEKEEEATQIFKKKKKTKINNKAIAKF